MQRWGGGQTEQGSLLPPHPPVSPASPTADPVGSRRARRCGLWGSTEQGKDLGPQACPHPESHSRAGLAQAGISRSEWSWPTRDVMFGGCFSWAGLLGGFSGKESACQYKRRGFNPWVEKIPWRILEGMETHSSVLAWRIS